MRDDDDDALVALASRGDRRALETLLDRHADRIHAVCRRIVAQPQDALDATAHGLAADQHFIERDVEYVGTTPQIDADRIANGNEIESGAVGDAEAGGRAAAYGPGARRPRPPARG